MVAPGSGAELPIEGQHILGAPPYEAAKRRALDDLYAVESSALPAGAARAQARIASDWEE